MSDTPEECLALCDSINAQSNRNTKHVRSVQQRCNDTLAAIDLRTSRQSIGNPLWVSRMKLSIWAEVQIDTRVGQGEQRARCERNRPVVVVWVE
jgi:hypothetical protein